VVGRIMKAAVPVGHSSMWTLAFGHLDFLAPPPAKRPKSLKSNQ
jgi:hypothetical protein